MTEPSKWRFGVRYQHRCNHESTTRLLPSSRCSISGSSKGSPDNRVQQQHVIATAIVDSREPPVASSRHAEQNRQIQRQQWQLYYTSPVDQDGRMHTRNGIEPSPRTRGAAFSLSLAGRVLLTGQICSCICGARVCRKSTFPCRRRPIAAAAADDERFNLQRFLLDCSIRTLKFRLFGRCPPVTR
jgi:hypothetical protein